MAKINAKLHYKELKQVASIIKHFFTLQKVAAPPTETRLTDILKNFPVNLFSDAICKAFVGNCILESMFF